MAPPRKHCLPSPLPEHFELTDTDKKKWKLGQIIGKGGFGLIYLASQDLDKPVTQDSNFVIKLENHENGPLFSELKFYQRAAKLENIHRWKKARKMDFLGIPDYWGSGLAEHNGQRYRFMVMERLGTDLQKVLDGNGGRLKPDTVFQLSCILLDVLEYIHEHEYVHADIKAANLMLGYGDPGKVYLADYGLCYRFCPDGTHKEYKENPKKGHNGTIEYTSLDAHNGVAPSRRGDLQILGFCLLHWLCGTLPWNAVLKNPAQVQEAKARLMDNLPNSVLQLPLDRAVSDKMADFFLRVKQLGYEQCPDYQALRTLLSAGGRRARGGQGTLDWSGPAGQLAGASTTRGPDKSKTRPREARSSAAAEDGGRPRPIAACYLRGPPIGPRAQPDLGKSRTKTAQDKRAEDFDLSVTSRQVDLRLTRRARLASPAQTASWTDQEDGPSTTPGLPQNAHSGQAHRPWEEPPYEEEDHSQNCDDDQPDDQRWGNQRWENQRWGNQRWENQRWGNQRWGNQRWGNQRWGNQRWENQRWDIRRYCHTDHRGYKQQYSDDGYDGDHGDSDYGDSDRGDSDYGDSDRGDSEYGDSDHGDGVTRAPRQEDSWSSRIYCAAGLVLILLAFLLVRQ